MLPTQEKAFVHLLVTTQCNCCSDVYHHTFRFCLFLNKKSTYFFVCLAFFHLILDMWYAFILYDIHFTTYILCHFITHFIFWIVSYGKNIQLCFQSISQLMCFWLFPCWCYYGWRALWNVCIDLFLFMYTHFSFFF